MEDLKLAFQLYLATFIPIIAVTFMMTLGAILGFDVSRFFGVILPGYFTGYLPGTDIEAWRCHIVVFILCWLFTKFADRG